MSQLPQNTINLEIINNEPRVSALAIADSTGNKYASIRELIKRFSNDIKEFGEISVADFKSATDSLGRTNKSKTVSMLNEQQATFLMTLLKNSPKVVEFKKALVKAFYELRATANELPQFPQEKQSNYFNEKFDLALALYAAYRGGAINPGEELLSNPELLEAYNSYPNKRSNLHLNQISKLIREPLLELQLISARQGQKYVANTDLSRAICDLGLMNMGVIIQSELSEYNKAIREGTIEPYVYQAPKLEKPKTKTKPKTKPKEIKQITIKVEHVMEDTDLSEELNIIIDAFNVPLNGLLSNHPTLTIVGNIRLLTQELELLSEEHDSVSKLDDAVLALTALLDIAEDESSSYPVSNQQIYSNLFLIIKNLERR